MGLHLADWCRKVGMEVVAACDRDPERRAVARAQLSGAVLVERWEELLEHRLDGVVLVNDFDEHAPLAIAFLDRGVHVLSESAACVDAAEGERLITAADRSSATYSFAENYVAHPHVRLIRQAIEAGELGRISLTEADYLHGMSPAEVAGLIGDPAHWRGRIAPTAYCTHTLSPARVRPHTHRGQSCRRRCCAGRSYARRGTGRAMCWFATEPTASTRALLRSVAMQRPGTPAARVGRHRARRAGGAHGVPGGGPTGRATRHGAAGVGPPAP